MTPFEIYAIVIGPLTLLAVGVLGYVLTVRSGHRDGRRSS